MKKDVAGLHKTTGEGFKLSFQRQSTTHNYHFIHCITLLCERATETQLLHNTHNVHVYVTLIFVEVVDSISHELKYDYLQENLKIINLMFN